MQMALAMYLEDDNNYNYLSVFFQQKRDVFLEAIKDSRFNFTPSRATYFQVLNYKKISQEHDVDFAKRLVTEFGVASIPLSVFNTNRLDEKVLRFCFAKKEETLLKAAEILSTL